MVKRRWHGMDFLGAGGKRAEQMVLPTPRKPETRRDGTRTWSPSQYFVLDAKFLLVAQPETNAFRENEFQNECPCHILQSLTTTSSRVPVQLCRHLFCFSAWAHVPTRHTSLAQKLKEFALVNLIPICLLGRVARWRHGQNSESVLVHENEESK